MAKTCTAYLKYTNCIIKREQEKDFNFKASD